MTRTTNTSIKRHKKVLRLSKGFRGARSKNFRVANNALMKALTHSYKGRKLKKRNTRTLNIIRLGAALRSYNISYSIFINTLKKNSITLNRKILSYLAIRDIYSVRHVLLQINKKQQY